MARGTARGKLSVVPTAAAVEETPPREADEIKVGSVVTLQSFGQDMTIEAIVTADDGSRWAEVLFSGKSTHAPLCRDRVPLAVLRLNRFPLA